MRELTKHLIVRYVISGGTSAAINLSLLSLLYYVFHIYYITSSVIAFIVSFFISLVLHKFWTFGDHSIDGVHRQAGKYLANSLLGLLLNTSILFVCVDFLHFYVFLGQIVAGILTACVTFFISRDYIFNQGI